MSSKQLSYPEILILKSLQSRRKRYGLEIRRAIQDSFNHRMNFSSLYPKLELLEARGYIKSEEINDEKESKIGARRKYFTITADGDKALSDWESAFNAVTNYVLSPQTT